MTSRPVPPYKTPTQLLDVDVLRSFIAIAETGSFTQGAKRVYRTPSALSMQIKSLENTLDSQLFVRNSRNVSLTPDGEVLLGYSRRLVRLNEETIRQFLTPRLEGVVRLGTPDDVGTRVLPKVLHEFAASHSAVTVNVLTGGSSQVLHRLDKGELDLALITISDHDIGQNRGEILHTEPLAWAGMKNGMAHGHRPLPLALADHGCAWRAMALEALDKVGMDYRIAYSSEHSAGQQAALKADLAVAPFPVSLIRPPLARLESMSSLPTMGNVHTAIVFSEDAQKPAKAIGAHTVRAFQAFQRKG